MTLLTALLITPAHALSCVAPGFTGSPLPAVVPADADLLVFHNSDDLPEPANLFDGPDVVPSTTEPFSKGVAVVRPLAPLQEGRTYRLDGGATFEIGAQV